MSALNSVKVSFGGDIRRFSLEGNSFVNLEEVIRSLFGINRNELVVRYLDDEGDWISVHTDMELATAFRFCGGTLKITVSIPPSSNGEMIPFTPDLVFVTPNLETVTPNVEMSDDEKQRPRKEKSKKCLKMEPGVDFVHTFHIKNDTDDVWPQTCRLVFKKKDRLSEQDSISFPRDISPGEEFDVSIPMKSPLEFGRYRSVWKMIGSDGRYFGRKFKVNVCVRKVVEDIDVQMSRLAVMGFKDKDLNEKILKQRKGNFDRAVFKLKKHQNKKHRHDRKLEKKKCKKNQRLVSIP